MKHFDFDVIVIGGGHAGAEAAHASARLGARTALITMSRETVGVMSCNPAIGGLGKGHLVREIDALDGIMGLAADRSGIQFRLLNRRKGPAVQGPRTQADRRLYRRAVQELVFHHPNITVVEAEVHDLMLMNDRIEGVKLEDGTQVTAPTVIVTTGTFLRGVIHIGDQRSSGGRMGSAAAKQLALRFDDLGAPLGRLKTGTPPRLASDSIDWARLEAQPGDDDPVMFSFLSRGPAVRQISCGITHTNERTHDLIRENLQRSAMYGGHIDGVGPRYCPSIEDKIVRFAEKTSHQIFLEPEGLDDNTVYPNGISTSLPQDVQISYVQTIAGLENARILQHGYAIEYDYVDPQALDHRLAYRGITGLFLAGQINGTTGYEEAAAQGLVAGLNAALEAAGRDPVVFSRSDSYIGVMIDDLVTRGVSEPYRMFTSRAEFRLSLRADNADQRLTPLGIALGCVDTRRKDAFDKKMSLLDECRSMLAGMSVTPNEALRAGIILSNDGARRDGLQLLSFKDVSFANLVALNPSLEMTAAEIREQVQKDATYANYLDRQARDVEALRRDEAIELPEGFDFDAVGGLSAELKSKLFRVQPRTLAQAARVDGMTPAGLTAILGAVKTLRRSESA